MIAVAPLTPEDKRLQREKVRTERQERLTRSREEKHVAWLEGEAALLLAQTPEQHDKQEAWFKYKKESAAATPGPRRGVALDSYDPRPPFNCTCAHRRKKHKSSGRCRGNCTCTAGVSRIRR